MVSVELLVHLFIHRRAFIISGARPSQPPRPGPGPVSPPTVTVASFLGGWERLRDVIKDRAVGRDVHPLPGVCLTASVEVDR
jgi:hypothetical protein